jgi:hypothetical protein
MGVLDRKETDKMIQEIMTKIESVEFSAVLGIASSFNVFSRMLYKQVPVKILMKKLQENTHEIGWQVFQRIVELSQKEIDSRYENPWDTAIAAYLSTLSLINLELAQVASGFILEAKNCWWSTKLAKYLMQDKDTVCFDTKTIEEFKNVNSNQYLNVHAKSMPRKKMFSSGRKEVIAFDCLQGIVMPPHAYRRIDKTESKKIVSWDLELAQSINT